MDISLLAQATLPHGLGRGRAGAARRRREGMGLSALAGVRLCSGGKEATVCRLQQDAFVQLAFSAPA